MKIVTEIPYKNPIVQKLEGKVVEYDNNISVGNVLLPELLSKKLQRRCANYEQIEDAIEDKELYVRGREFNGKIEWFGLVSGEFKSMDPEFLNQHLETKAKDRIIRYDAELERVQIGYVLDSNGHDRTMIHVDSGNFGVYGGNGESAVKIGVSITNNDPNVWTLFYNPDKSNREQNSVHKRHEKSVGAILKEQYRYAEKVKQDWEQASIRDYSAIELEQLAKDYLARQEAILANALQRFPTGTSGRQFVAQLHRVAAEMTGIQQLGLEERIGSLIQHAL